MIFNLLGTPSDDDINALEREDARRYIKCFAKRDGEGLYKKFSHVDVAAVGLLEKMLRISAKERIAVAAALEDGLFSEVRDSARETVADKLVSLDFEKEPDLDEGLLRHYFRNEIAV